MWDPDFGSEIIKWLRRQFRTTVRRFHVRNDLYDRLAPLVDSEEMALDLRP
jgi:hypothetical protein